MNRQTDRLQVWLTKFTDSTFIPTRYLTRPLCSRVQRQNHLAFLRVYQYHTTNYDKHHMLCDRCSHGGIELQDWLKLPEGYDSLDACWNAVVANPSCINGVFDYAAEGVSVADSCRCRLHEDSFLSTNSMYATHLAGDRKITFL